MEPHKIWRYLFPFSSFPLFLYSLFIIVCFNENYGNLMIHGEPKHLSHVQNLEHKIILDHSIGQWTREGFFFFYTDSSTLNHTLDWLLPLFHTLIHTKEGLVVKGEIQGKKEAFLNTPNLPKYLEGCLQLKPMHLHFSLGKWNIQEYSMRF